MDLRAVAVSAAFVGALIAGVVLGWWQGSLPSQEFAAASTSTTGPAAPVADFPVTAIEPASGVASPDEEQSAPQSYDGKAFGIGDSVLAGAAPCLAARGIEVNAKQSRQVAQALDVLGRKGAPLPPRVIVHLGTNGGATAADLDAIMAVLGPERLVMWATIQLPDDPDRYTYERSTNDAISALADRYDNVLILDWESLSRQHPEWMYVEGIHMTPEGCEGYAALAEARLRAPSSFGNS